jgi:hypothetical protein
VFLLFLSISSVFVPISSFLCISLVVTKFVPHMDVQIIYLKKNIITKVTSKHYATRQCYDKVGYDYKLRHRNETKIYANKLKRLRDNFQGLK